MTWINLCTNIETLSSKFTLKIYELLFRSKQFPIIISENWYLFVYLHVISTQLMHFQFRFWGIILFLIFHFMSWHFGIWHLSCYLLNCEFLVILTLYPVLCCPHFPSHQNLHKATLMLINWRSWFYPSSQFIFGKIFKIN